MAAKKNGKRFLKHIDVQIRSSPDEPWESALVHVYLDEEKLVRLACQAARNKGKRARTGPIECRAYLK